MHRSLRRAAALSALTALALTACHHEAKLSNLASEFVYTTLSLSPGLATQQGLHRFAPPGSRDSVPLDTLLDDLSPASLQRQRDYFAGVHRRLADIRRDALDAQTQVDYDLLSDAAAFATVGLDKERFFERKPQLYSELLGSALFANISLEYADTAARARHLTARLRQVPRFIDVAIGNLKASNDVYRSVALDEMNGVSQLVSSLGAAFVRGTPSAAAYDSAQRPALAAIERFNAFVRDSLPKLGQFDWRMGRELFDVKWHYVLASSIAPGEMLKSAQDSMIAIRRQMLSLSLPLHAAWFAGHRHPVGDTTALINTVVTEVLARIGQEHVHRDSLETQAKADVQAAGRFVTEHRLLSLTDFSNIRVIPTPQFMRGIYGVAGAVFAPPLDSKLSSFYWVTPIPTEWPRERAEAKLREYNRYKLLSLTIHEALPGHLLQGEYANRVTPAWRKLLRTVFGNGPYAEGWAVYAEHVMEQAGMNGGDSVKARLTALKGMLRIYSNVIIDARLHTENMPTDSVVPFLVRESFQEEPEATAKLQRAQLDYVQLNYYPVGLHEWWKLRREAEQKEGTAFNLCRFHDTVLSYGAIPVPAVRRLYFDHVTPTADTPPSRCGA
jgi:hypothetical protein